MIGSSTTTGIRSANTYNINTDETQEADASAFELRKQAQEASEPQLIRMLMELALLPSGYSEEPLAHTDPLASAAQRYGISLKPKKNTKAKPAKCGPKAKNARKPSKSKPASKPAKRTAVKGGAA